MSLVSLLVSLSFIDSLDVLGLFPPPLVESCLDFPCKNRPRGMIVCELESLTDPFSPVSLGGLSAV